MRVARSPFNPKIPKVRQKALAKQLRTALAETAMDMQRMTEALAIPPEEVVVVLRRLRRRRRRGHLRSAIRFGHVCWWWEPEPEQPDEGETAGKKGGKKRRKKRAEPADLDRGAPLGQTGTGAS